MATIGHNTRPTDAELASAFLDLEPIIGEVDGAASILELVLDGVTGHRRVAGDDIMLVMTAEQEEALLISVGNLRVCSRTLRQNWRAASEGLAHG